MPTPVPTIDITKSLYNPGILLKGTLGSGDPTNTVSGSVFTDDWSAASGWVAMGPTEAGSQFHDTLTTEDLTYAESFYPGGTITTGRDATIDFALANITATNIKIALNGAGAATSGSGATLLTTVTPALIGAEVDCMIGWESNDHTVRIVGYQAHQVGAIEPEFRKGATKALLTCSFRFAQTSAGYAYRIFLAGATRGA